MATSYEDTFANVWAIEQRADSGIYVAALAQAAYDTMPGEIVIAAETPTEAKQAIEEYAAEHAETGAKPAPRIRATRGAPVTVKPVESSGMGPFLLFLAAMWLLGSRKGGR